MSDAPPLGYTPKYFAPNHVHSLSARPDLTADTRLAPVYVYADEIVLAVNVAIATRRPLLVRGEPGSGKSSLARNVADVLGWRYYEAVITSRTQARDLLWDVDLVRRLHDARPEGAGLPSDYAPYLIPGVLWWAFDRTSAAWRGTDPKKPRFDPLPDPQSFDAERAVVLLDEIDKADPDLPNNLLVPLGSLQFRVDETGTVVTSQGENAPLVLLTTNEERWLPAAFLRRCVEVKLERPRRSRLLEIAQAHYPGVAATELHAVANAMLGPPPTDGSDPESPIDTAEFLDTVRAKVDLEVDLAGQPWKDLTAITAWKHGRAAPG